MSLSFSFRTCCVVKPCPAPCQKSTPAKNEKTAASNNPYQIIPDRTSGGRISRENVGAFFVWRPFCCRTHVPRRICSGFASQLLCAGKYACGLRCVVVCSMLVMRLMLAFVIAENWTGVVHWRAADHLHRQRDLQHLGTLWLISTASFACAVI